MYIYTMVNYNRRKTLKVLYARSEKTAKLVWEHAYCVANLLWPIKLAKSHHLTSVQSMFFGGNATVAQEIDPGPKSSIYTLEPWGGQAKPETRQSSGHHSHCRSWMWSKHHHVWRDWRSSFIRCLQLNTVTLEHFWMLWETWWILLRNWHNLFGSSTWSAVSHVGMQCYGAC